VTLPIRIAISGLTGNRVFELSAASLVFVTVTPVCFAVAVTIDPVAVLVTVGPAIVTVASTGDDATRKAHERREGAQYGYSFKCIH
jgi:hypothetical protein